MALPPAIRKAHSILIRQQRGTGRVTKEDIQFLKEFKSRTSPQTRESLERFETKQKELERSFQEGGARTTQAIQKDTGKPFPRPKVRPEPTEQQRKRAKALTEEEQKKQYGKVLEKTKTELEVESERLKVTPTQLKRAEVFTEEKQIKEYGKVLVKQTKNERQIFEKGLDVSFKEGRTTKFEPEVLKRAKLAIKQQEVKKDGFITDRVSTSNIITNNRVRDDSNLDIQRNLLFTKENQGLEKFKQKIEQQIEPYQTKPDLKQMGYGFALGGLDTAIFFKALKEKPKETLKLVFTGLKEGTKKLVTGEGFPELGKAIRDRPMATTGKLLEFGVEARAGGKILSTLYKYGKAGTTLINPKFRKVTKTEFGEKEIKDIPLDSGKMDMGLIPKGSKPKLDIDLGKLELKEIPFRETPIIPKASKLQTRIIEISKGKKDTAFTGSFSQKTFVKGSRDFDDIDVVTPNPELLAKEIGTKLKKSVLIEKVTINQGLTKFDIFRVKSKRTGKVIADIDPLKYAEEGLIKSSDIITLQGLSFVSPRVRLKAKSLQLARGKRKGGKVPTDIEQLTAGQFQESPLTRGAYGYSQAEQKAFIGKTGIVTTSARDLFGLISKRKVKIESREGDFGLFATPFDIKTGKPMTRESRLLLEPKEATALDLVTGDFEFRAGKPQIVFFEDVTIGKEFKPFGIKSTELEVTLPPSSVIQRGKTKAVTLIAGERVPIVQAKILGSEDISKLSTTQKESILKASKGNLISSDVRRLQKDISKTIGKKIEVQVRRPPKARLGLRVTTPRPPKMKLTPRSTLSRLTPRRPTPSRPSLRLITRRPTARITPRSTSFRLTTRTPSRSLPPYRPITRTPPPRSPPVRRPPPRKPPTRVPPKKSSRTKLLKRIKELKESKQGYNVLIKKKLQKLAKGKYKSKGYAKANTKPLTKKEAEGLLFSKLDTYANRSGKVVLSNKKVTSSNPNLLALRNKLINKFRSSKKNPKVFVEKSKYAIDSLQEKRSIPYEAIKRRAKTKRKKATKKRKKKKSKSLIW